MVVVELLVARNPDPDSRLPYLIRVPLGEGLVYRARDRWPRTAAVYCHPVPLDDWPDSPDLVDVVPLVSCARRGAAIDIVADRAREQRSQIVLTRARGREAVFWQSPRTRKQARPDVRPPTARAGGRATPGAEPLRILVDTRERYPWTFPSPHVETSRRALPCGDYAVAVGDAIVAAVERKTLDNLVTGLVDGSLRYALGELAALPRAAVVVDDRWSRVFSLTHRRPAEVADGLAELQARWPAVPVVWAETRPLAAEWTYRFLAACAAWARDDASAVERLMRDHVSAAPAGPLATGAAATPITTGTTAGPAVPDAGTAEIRAWARTAGLPVSDRGRLRADIVAAWRAANDR
jgi:hypothetical protein